jgi:hypothetical protein
MDALDDRPEGNPARRVGLRIEENLRVGDGEAGVTEQRSIGVGARAAEKHGHPEPVLDALAVSSREHRREEDPTGPKPVHDPSHERAELSSRQVEQNIQSDDAIE